MSKYEFKANSAAQIAAAKDLANLNWPASRKVMLNLVVLAIWLVTAGVCIPSGWFVGKLLGEQLDVPLLASLGTIVGGVVGLVFFSWIWKRVCPWLSKRLSKNRIFETEGVSVTADESGVCWQTEHSVMQVRWSGIQLVTVAPSGVLFVRGISALYLPRELFGDEQEMQALVDECEAYRSAAQT